MLRGVCFAVLFLHSGLAFGQPQEPPNCKEARDRVEKHKEERKIVNADHADKSRTYDDKARDCRRTMEKKTRDCWKPYNTCSGSAECSKARETAKRCARDAAREYAVTTCAETEWNALQEAKETSYQLTLKENDAFADQVYHCNGVRPRP